MTSYSIYNPADMTDVDDVRECRFQSLLHGAARAVLDTAVMAGADPAEPGEVEAIEYHAPVPGWELDAIHPDDRDRFAKRVREFFDATYTDLCDVVGKIRIAPHCRYVHLFGGDGEAWYRAGELFVHSARAGDYWDLSNYSATGERAHAVARAAGPVQAEATPADHEDAGYVRLITY